MSLDDIIKLAGMLQSHAPIIVISIFIIGLVNTMLTAGKVPIALKIPAVWRGVVVIVLSAVAGALDSIEHGTTWTYAVIAGVPVLLVALYRDHDLIVALTAWIPWIGPWLGGGDAGGDVPPDPKAAPPGTRGALRTMLPPARESGRRGIGLLVTGAVLVFGLYLDGCSLLTPKTGADAGALAVCVLLHDSEPVPQIMADCGANEAKVVEDILAANDKAALRKAALLAAKPCSSGGAQ